MSIISVEALRAAKRTQFTCPESPVAMVRVACYVKDIDKAIFLADQFADKGYETAVNIMAISKAPDNELTEAFHQLNEECKAGVVYIVDSNGALYQETTELLVKKAKDIIKNKEIAEGYKKYFELVWNAAKP